MPKSSFTFYTSIANATYNNGKPGPKNLTKAHEDAEKNKFKEALFGTEETRIVTPMIIPKKLYAARVIQQFAFIKALETQLQTLSSSDQPELKAFFALTYLQELWRTPAMKNDLRNLGVDPDNIPENSLTNTTKAYLEEIKTLSPEHLLYHFVVHIAGYMHGGNNILELIAPSNQLTRNLYTIPSEQYDFSSACNKISSRFSVKLFKNMMETFGDKEISEEKYKELFDQCTHIYKTTASIYNDLSDMYLRHPQQAAMLMYPDHPQPSAYLKFAAMGVCIIVLPFILNLLSDPIEPVFSSPSPI